MPTRYMRKILITPTARHFGVAAFVLSALSAAYAQAAPSSFPYELRQPSRWAPAAPPASTEVETSVESDLRGSCAEILAANASAPSGQYEILLEGVTEPVNVFCDMTEDGGGWTLIGKFNGTWDETLAAPHRNALPYTEVKVSENGLTTLKQIRCHATPTAGFAQDNSRGVNCTVPDVDGATYSVRVLQIAVARPPDGYGNYGLYSGGINMLDTGGCHWYGGTTQVWGRHYGGTPGSCSAYGKGEVYVTSRAWSSHTNWLFVR